MRDIGKVKVFGSSVSSEQKRRILSAMATSGRSAGLDCELVFDRSYTLCDVAVVWGMAKDPEQATLRAPDKLRLRNDIHASHRGPLVIVEAPVLGRRVPPWRKRPWLARNLIPRNSGWAQRFAWAQADYEILKEFRIGINGCLGDDGGFALAPYAAGERRWAATAQRLGLPRLKPYRKSGTHIVVVGQVPGDASLRGTDVDSWIISTCAELRTFTGRPIIVRLHPGARDPSQQLVAALQAAGIELDDVKRPLSHALIGAWCVVTYSSGAAIDALLQGIPAFALSSASFAWDVTDHDLSRIESPRLAGREAWLGQVAAIQWSAEEFAAGAIWKPIVAAITGHTAPQLHEAVTKTSLRA